MAETEAAIGYGASFAIKEAADADFVEIAEVNDITPPSDKVDTVDATHMKSPNATREFILGLNDPGEASFDMNFIPGGTGDTKMQSVRQKRMKVQCRITFPAVDADPAVTWTFSGILTGYEVTVPTDDKMKATATFKVTGSYVAGVAA